MSKHPCAAASLVLTVLVCALTWPQCLHLTSQFAWHNDPQFSIWRLAWIAHALHTDPRHLFDANIFYPATRTLAYSDATLLEGAIGAPLLWAGVPPVLVYNLLLLAGFIGSGVGMFVLARYLTCRDGPALVAASIFALVPYRIEHFAHLELQWAMWIPLAFWAMHRASETGSWRVAALAGFFLWLQILSCVYYGVFLAGGIMVVAVALVATAAERAAVTARLAAAFGVAALLTGPYARPYLETARDLGPRRLAEIARYSARPLNYLAAPAANWTAIVVPERFGGAERVLYPGIVATALAVFAFVRSREAVGAQPSALSSKHRPDMRKTATVYLALCALGVAMSFGPRGIAGDWLRANVPLVGGFRAWARAAILVYAGLAVMAAIGVARLQTRLGGSKARRVGLITAILILVFLDYQSGAMPLTDPPTEPAVLYTAIRSAAPAVLIELPLPRTDALPGRDAVYMLWSLKHWQPLANGYSGYYPPAYLDTLDRMINFPDDRSIAHLRGLGVRFVAIHRAFYRTADDYASVVTRSLNRSDLVARGRFDQHDNEASLFELVPR